MQLQSACAGSQPGTPEGSESSASLSVEGLSS